MDRLETLKQFLETRPEDCFVRYGVAQEYVKRGELEQAIEQFEKIRELDADYQATYFHLGKTYEKAGRPEDARKSYEQGIEVSMRTGDAHARSELQGALDELG